MKINQIRIVSGVLFLLVGLILVAGTNYGPVREAYAVRSNKIWDIEFDVIKQTGCFGPSMVQHLSLHEGDSATIRLEIEQEVPHSEVVTLTVCVKDILNTTIRRQEFVYELSSLNYEAGQGGLTTTKWFSQHSGHYRHRSRARPVGRFTPALQLVSSEPFITFDSSAHQDFWVYVEGYLPVGAGASRLSVFFETRVVRSPPFDLVMILGLAFSLLGTLVLTPSVMTKLARA